MEQLDIHVHPPNTQTTKLHTDVTNFTKITSKWIMIA